MEPTTSTPEPHIGHARVFIAAGLGLSLAAVSFATPLFRISPPKQNVSVEVLGTQTVSASSAPACQVDPLRVGYRTRWDLSLKDFAVGYADVNGMDPACSGAQVTVTLAGSTGTTLSGGWGTATASGPTVSVAMATNPGPPVRGVYTVSIQTSGGFAVPPDCSGMSFQNQITATPGSYTINGTNQADLVYGLTGPYSISGLQGNDCVSAYDGNTVNDGNGNDVILASVGTSGSNTVTAGNGNDLVKLGGGTDNVTVGNGTDVVYGGTGRTSISGANGTYTFYTGGRAASGPPPSSASPTTVQVGNGAHTTIFGGNGDLTLTSPTNGSATIYLSTGPGAINGGGTNNTCHVPTVNSYTIANCKVVHP